MSNPYRNNAYEEPPRSLLYVLLRDLPWWYAYAPYKAIAYESPKRFAAFRLIDGALYYRPWYRRLFGPFIWSDGWLEVPFEEAGLLFAEVDAKQRGARLERNAQLVQDMKVTQEQKRESLLTRAERYIIRRSLKDV